MMLIAGVGMIEIGRALERLHRVVEIDEVGLGEQERAVEIIRLGVAGIDQRLQERFSFLISGCRDGILGLLERRGRHAAEDTDQAGVIHRRFATPTVSSPAATKAAAVRR
jgi:hypothetical protein